VGLNLWVSKRIEKVNQIIQTSEETDPKKRESDFNCKLILTKSYTAG
jgi:hypothetical protein